MALIIHHPKRVIGGAALAVAALLGALGWWVYPYAEWFYRTVPIKEFKPVCGEEVPGYGTRLTYLDGQLTDEFIYELYKDQRDENGYWRFTNYFDGKIYKTLKVFSPLPEMHSRLNQQEQEISYYMTDGPAYAIFEKRRKAGVFDRADMSDFMVERRQFGEKTKVMQLMGPRECGFLEELVLVGGRFAEPPPDAKP